MSGCNNVRTVGRNSKLYVAIQCQDEDPETSTLLPLGAVNTKSFSIDGNTIEFNDSLASSGFVETQMGTSSLSLSVSGNYVRNPTDYPNDIFINQLLVHRFNSVRQDLSQDPVILVKYVRPDVTLTAYMMIQSINVEDPDAEGSSFTMELTNASSPTYPPTLLPTA